MHKKTGSPDHLYYVIAYTLRNTDMYCAYSIAQAKKTGSYLRSLGYRIRIEDEFGYEVDINYL